MIFFILILLAVTVSAVAALVISLRSAAKMKAAYEASLTDHQVAVKHILSEVEARDRVIATLERANREANEQKTAIHNAADPVSSFATSVDVLQKLSGKRAKSGRTGDQARPAVDGVSEP